MLPVDLYLKTTNSGPPKHQDVMNPLVTVDVGPWGHLKVEVDSEPGRMCAIDGIEGFRDKFVV
jgi:hypothetical protein